METTDQTSGITSLQGCLKDVSYPEVQKQFSMKKIIKNNRIVIP